MRIHTLYRTLPLGLLLAAIPLGSQAQTTATWIGPASGGLWNNPLNWDTGLPPGYDVNGTTNAIIGAGTNVSYSFPMSAPSFGSLTLNGVLSVNTNAFNCSAISLTIPTGGDRLFMTNSGTVVAVFNNLTMGTNSYAVLGGGASLTVGSLLVDYGASSHAAGTSIFTNSGGILTANTTTVNNNTGTGTGLLLINGGTNYLGNTSVGRANAGAGGATLGTEGLVINNGLVVMTNLNLGNAGNGASSLSAYITGGTITNYGSVYINQGTSGRFSRLLQTGGLFVVPDPGVVNPNPTVAGSLNNYTVFGGTNIVGGFYFGNSNLAPGTVNFTNGAAIYVGSQGINSNGAVVVNALLNGGALFGATAPWTNAVNMKLASGTFTFKTAGLDNTPNNITLSNVLNGAGALNVTGGGILTFDATNTYAGNTLVSGGTLALGGSGGLSSPQISLASGTTFDVSGTGGFPLNGNQTVAGFGTVNGPVIAASAATIFPGSNAVTGTLTFTGGLTENGGVNNEFYLSGSPTGPNDFISVTGGLNLAGVNTITIVGSLASDAPYPLISYDTLTGDTSNLAVSGPTGVFSNSVVTHTIYFIAQSSIRGPTNIVWVGNAAANWDTLTTTNWLNAGQLDFFVANDNVLFNNLGTTNPVVNLPGIVMPSSVTVNTSSNYTFSGPGAIGGAASLTVSNGTLTVLTTNSYTGPTVFAGGILATPVLANSGSPSGIGAATADPANIIFSGGTLNYFGASTSTDHGMTITNQSAIFDVTNGTTLTLNGGIIGNGGLTKVDNGGLTLNTGNSYTGNTLVNGGTLTLANVGSAGSGSIILNGGTLAVGAVVPANKIIVTNNSVITGGNAGGLTGVGVITGTSNLLLAVSASTGVFDLTGDMSTYSGTITLSNVLNALSVRLDGSTTSEGSQLATWDLGAGPMDLLIRVSCPSNNLGALRGSVSTTLSGRGGSANTGGTTFYIGANGLSTTFDGIIRDGSNVGSTTAINKVGSGSLALSGASTYTGNTTISSGTLALVYNPTNGTDGSFDTSPSVNIASGAVLDVSGRSDGTLQVGYNTQTLTGRGTILGSMTVNGSGTVVPGGGTGGGTGILTVTNAINLYGTAWMKLNRDSSPNSDRLVSTLSTVTYNGTLVVTNIGAPLQPGDTFTLFSGGGLNVGAFGSIVLPNYYNFDLSQLPVSGTITVISAYKPAFSAVDFSALSSGLITLNVTNGAVSGSLTVLTSTNVAGPWVTNSTTTFDGSGNLSGYPVTVDQTQPQLFIKLQAQ